MLTVALSLVTQAATADPAPVSALRTALQERSGEGIRSLGGDLLRYGWCEEPRPVASRDVPEALSGLLAVYLDADEPFRSVGTWRGLEWHRHAVERLEFDHFLVVEAGFAGTRLVELRACGMIGPK